MRIFHFYRHEDQSGVSGTGAVVEGVEFTNGWCAVRWLSEMSSLCFYQTLEQVQAIHSHGGRTEIVISDFQPQAQHQKKPSKNARYETMMRMIDEATQLLSYSETPEATTEDYRASIHKMRSLLNSIEKGLE